MNKLKRCSVIFALVLTMGVFTACGMKPEEAKAYTQAVLDAIYLGEFDAYMEQTESTKEEAQEMYEGNIELTVAEMGLEEEGVSEEVTDKFKQVLFDLAKHARYTIGEVKEIEDGYEVEVIVEPFIGFETLEDDLTNVLIDKINDMKEIPSDEEINQMTYELMSDLMAESVENPTYDEAESVRVHVIRDSEGVYHIPDEDRTALDETMFPME
ncbi:MAG: hypothetical protein ACI4UH_05015 [Dorea sp.]